MRAAVYHGRHDIRIESVPEPADPAGGDVVLDVLRSAICGTDSSEWSHGPLLARPGVILGHEFVGRVAEVGDDVVDLAVGDRVVSGAGVSCGVCEWCRAGRINLCHEIEVTTTLAHVCDVDLPESLQIISGSDLASIVLDRVIPLDALVDEGIRPLAEGTARGKIVINPLAA